MAGMVEPPQDPRRHRGVRHLPCRVGAPQAGHDVGPGRGRSGRAGQPYGDPAGHSWLALDGPATATRNVSTGLDSRPDNMVEFAHAALLLFVEVLETG